MSESADAVERVTSTDKTPTTSVFDDDGNLIGDGRKEYRWDAENRLIEISMPAVEEASTESRTYTYDYNNRQITTTARVSTVLTPTTTSTQTVCVYDGENVLLEYTLGAAGQLQPATRALWGLDVSGTLTDGGGTGGLLLTTQMQPPEAASYRPYFDGSGTIVALASAAETDFFAYGPFGEILNTANLDTNRAIPGYASKRIDLDTRLTNFGRRHYSPVIGRWLSRDPLGEAGGDLLYGYVDNSPLEKYDPIGLKTLYLSNTMHAFIATFNMFTNWRIALDVTCSSENRLSFKFHDPTFKYFSPLSGWQIGPGYKSVGIGITPVIDTVEVSPGGTEGRTQWGDSRSMVFHADAAWKRSSGVQLGLGGGKRFTAATAAPTFEFFSRVVATGSDSVEVICYCGKLYAKYAKVLGSFAGMEGLFQHSGWNAY